MGRKTPKAGDLPPDDVWVLWDAEGTEWRRLPIMNDLWRAVGGKEAGALRAKGVDKKYGPLTWELQVTGNESPGGGGQGNR